MNSEVPKQFKSSVIPIDLRRSANSRILYNIPADDLFELRIIRGVITLGVQIWTTPLPKGWNKHLPREILKNICKIFCNYEKCYLSPAGWNGSMSTSGSAGPECDPRRDSKFLFENFQPRVRRGGDVHFLIDILYITGLDSIPNPSAVCMLRRHIILLIVIRPSDCDVKPGGPLGAFREEQAMSRHRVSPSPFLSSSHTPQHNYTTKTTTHTVTLTSTSYSTLYRYSSHT